VRRPAVRVRGGTAPGPNDEARSRARLLPPVVLHWRAPDAELLLHWPSFVVEYACGGGASVPRYRAGGRGGGAGGGGLPAFCRVGAVPVPLEGCPRQTPKAPRAARHGGLWRVAPAYPVPRSPARAADASPRGPALNHLADWPGALPVGALMDSCCVCPLPRATSGMHSAGAPGADPGVDRAGSKSDEHCPSPGGRQHARAALSCCRGQVPTKTFEGPEHFTGQTADDAHPATLSCSSVR